MTFCRSVSLGRFMSILVTSMKPVGFARYLSRLASSQVTPASFIAGEKSYPGTEALLLPTMPASDGPTSFLPGCVEWQATQWVANTVWPAEESPRRALSASFRHGHQDETCFAHRRPHFVRPHLTSSVGSTQRAMRRDQSVAMRSAIIFAPISHAPRST